MIASLPVRVASLVVALTFACSASPSIEMPMPMECSSPAEYCEPIPLDSRPCHDATPWPLRLESTMIPVTVHYSTNADRDIALDVQALLETAWRVEVDDLGFSPPMPDGGLCGDDDRYDVFLWRGSEESYVEALAEVPETAHDDWTTYMVVDPWGTFGGELLPSTIAHELNHALQASDDWWESPLVFEMTATFMEEVVFPERNDYMFTLVDFQTRPDWSVHRSDDWETWYMYGASLYLQFLRARYFGGDASFAAEMWRESRSDPSRNEPDFLDALEALLSERGSTGAESIAEFARWRWYTGSRDDGEHFEDGALFPSEALVPLAASVSASGEIELPEGPMNMGSVYIEVTRGAGEPAAPSLSLLSPATDVRWVVQAVPGNAGSDGDTLKLDGGPAILDLSEHATRTLIVTAIGTSEFDPDEPSDRRYEATLRLD